MSEAPVFTVYLREGCSLCEQMLIELADRGQGEAFSVSRVDVDADPQLAAAYGEKVPVLVGPDGLEICHFFLDPEALARYFASC